ncbi:sugar ABC transporter permease [Arcanobacterium haemolyticum]|uniref:Binding-protein-dependent transport systems inner membrane component n=1 Tax=Arcanobacterium haemolyticum (strain ATCC 9345 / DSM 20595 / CCM 5947 / CCUG 17215 / LMG 16163 / NBRC 15585 / NCTC 8452 / 11018) TaxID=644284 RepID=D7BMI7_ARCHD|nr:sugar ABC transporter permease [Arcanobacterium haemolyticum]ADH92136.1 binding-protein-dependent transport systems inner membrane component [Arcanobacterium haemolyticum DSM 20595]QCX46298.1 sugar ABC transporter permease [Arcanobacterium haemolyticum]SPT74759.1 Maltose transport system permease protein malG [Arcanobacterium haemolyticum]SQH29159.1 Maltose transport system permease protein malG [Arcanobacterium haemolyticum]
MEKTRETRSAVAATGTVANNKVPFGKWFRETGFRHVLAVLAVLYAAFPILYIVSAALNPDIKTTLTGANKLFTSVSVDNFTELSDTMFWTWFSNTLIIGIATAIGTVLMGAAAAYAFSRFRFSGRRMTLMSLMVIQMFPQLLTFVAIFLLLTTLGDVFPVLGIDSKLALICVYLGGALGANTFLMYGFFNSIPMELDEAAKIDGATHSQVYWTIIMPLVIPILAVVGLLSFISSFNDFILARTILTSQENWTLAVGMNLWVGGNEKAWDWFAAGSIIAAVPILLLFLFLQKYIVSGLTGGAVKG